MVTNEVGLIKLVLSKASDGKELRNMKKIITQEIYPSDLLGKEMVMTQMTHHYRRVASAKPRVDTNLSRHNSPRPLSAEASKTVNRHYRGDASPPKHRACLKYCQENNGPLFKPTIYSTGAESRLRERCEIYHPPVKQLRNRNSKDKLGENEILTECSTLKNEERIQMPEKLEKSVQTLRIFNFRPLHKKSVKFLKDITDEALTRGAQTNIALERIFRNHQERNKYRLPMELIDRELDMLRRELRMPLASRKSSDSYVSDEDALRALDRLALKPETKREVIATLRLVEKEKSAVTVEGVSNNPNPKQCQTKDSANSFLERGENTKTASHQYLNKILESEKEEEKPINRKDEEIIVELESTKKKPEEQQENEEEEHINGEIEKVPSEVSSSSSIKPSNQDQTNEHESAKLNSFTNADFTSSSQHLSVRNMSQLEAIQKFEKVVEGKDTEETKDSRSPTFEEDGEDEEEEEVKTDEVDEDQHTDSEVESLPNSGSSVSSVHTE